MGESSRSRGQSRVGAHYWALRRSDEISLDEVERIGPHLPTWVRHPLRNNSQLVQIAESLADKDYYPEVGLWQVSPSLLIFLRFLV